MSTKNNPKIQEEINKINRQIETIKTWAWVAFWMGFGILVLSFCYHLLSGSKYNEFGDFVGGIVGSLWSLTGLLFIYVAFLGQKIEIKYQKEDLELTRVELRESREVFKNQAKIMKYQQLDNTFFNLLNNHRKNIEGVHHISEGKDYTGHDCIDVIYNEVKNDFDRHAKVHIKKFENDFFKYSKNPSKKLQEYADLELLYSELCNLVMFVKDKMDNDDLEFYLNTLSTNLSREEKFLILAYDILIGDNSLNNLIGSFPIVQYEFIHQEIEKLELVIKEQTVKLESGVILNYPSILIPNKSVELVDIIHLVNRKQHLMRKRFNKKNIKKCDLYSHLKLLYEDDFEKNLFSPEGIEKSTYDLADTYEIVLRFRLNDLTYIRYFKIEESIDFIREEVERYEIRLM